MTPDDLDYVHTLQRAKAIVRASVLWPRFLEHTPLENDVAVWMTDFAFQFLRDTIAVGAVAALPAARPEPPELFKRLIESWNKPVDRTAFGLEVNAAIYDEARADCVMELQTALRSMELLLVLRDAARPEPPAAEQVMEQARQLCEKGCRFNCDWESSCNCYAHEMYRLLRAAVHAQEDASRPPHSIEQQRALVASVLADLDRSDIPINVQQTIAATFGVLLEACHAQEGPRDE